MFAKFVTCLIFILSLLAGLAGPASAEALRFPPMQGKMLDGAEVSLPEAMVGTPHLVLFLFDRAQQDQLDSWAGAAAQLPDGTKMVEIALIGKVNGLVKFFITGGMKDALADKSRHGRTLPYFGDVEAVKSALAFEDISQVRAFYLTAAGEIIWQGGGDYTGQFAELPR